MCKRVIAEVVTGDVSVVSDFFFLLLKLSSSLLWFGMSTFVISML